MKNSAESENKMNFSESELTNAHSLWNVSPVTLQEIPKGTETETMKLVFNLFIQWLQ